MTSAVLGQAQAVGEQPDQIVTGHHAAQQREARLPLQALENQAQRLAELVTAKSLETGLPARRLQERALLETDRFDA